MTPEEGWGDEDFTCVACTGEGVRTVIINEWPNVNTHIISRTSQCPACSGRGGVSRATFLAQVDALTAETEEK